MQIQTAWVKPPAPATGLDHLGVQAPCIGLYGQLLPGITNVTDRARYYSFYPWFLWGFDQLTGPKTAELFEDYFRRADCLFTLIAERHARKTEEEEGDGADNRHGIAMVGRDTLVKAVRGLSGRSSLDLAEFATREDDNPNRYFKNRLGGLGQYYLGTLQELGLVAGTRNGVVQYTHERGAPLAEAVDQQVDRGLFFRVVQRGRASIDELDRLAAFCPCCLQRSTMEHELLLDLFFDRRGEHEQAGEQRRLSLTLLLQLGSALTAAGQGLDEVTFRACCYTGSLGRRKSWDVPSLLESTRRAWGVYERNELLSIAVQGLFAASLDALGRAGQQFWTGRQFAEWFVTAPDVRRALGRRAGQTFEEAVAATARSLPPYDRWDHDDHEFQVAYQLFDRSGPQLEELARSEMIDEAVRILLALAARALTEPICYEPTVLPDHYFRDYPVNLLSLRNGFLEWNPLTLREWLAWLTTEWGIDLHLRVALRKLRGESKDTFRVRPTEQGLCLNAVPRPVFTNPRFRQATQILCDLGTLNNKGGSYQPTDLGLRLLEAVCEH